MIQSKRTASVVLALVALVQYPGQAHAFENVNMATQISVGSDGKMLVRWSVPGFDHYNVRWSTTAGENGQRERPGDKDFTVLMRYVAGHIYTIGVQGCESRTLARSQCTSWDTVSCGSPNTRCLGGPAIAWTPHAPTEGRRPR